MHHDCDLDRPPRSRVAVMSSDDDIDETPYDEAAAPAVDETATETLQPAIENGTGLPGADVQADTPLLARPQEFVREKLSEAQLMARAGVVSKRYGDKLLPEKLDKMCTNMAKAFLVRAVLNASSSHVHPPTLPSSWLRAGGTHSYLGSCGRAQTNMLLRRVLARKISARNSSHLRSLR